jgi:hypothetical protein
MRLSKVLPENALDLNSTLHDISFTPQQPLFLGSKLAYRDLHVNHNIST